jgi:hypothetical protein
LVDKALYKDFHIFTSLTTNLTDRVASVTLIDISSPWDIISRRINIAPESRRTHPFSVPPNIDESRWKRRLTVLENHAIEFGCPVSGIPTPDITWLVNGQQLQSDSGDNGRGIRLGADKTTVRMLGDRDIMPWAVDDRFSASRPRTHVHVRRDKQGRQSRRGCGTDRPR